MILIISSVFPPEPVVSATIANDLANSLSANRNVTVITPKPTRPSGYIFDNTQITNKGYEHIILNSYTCPKSKLFGRLRESYSFGIHARQYIMNNIQHIQGIFIHAWPLFAQYIIVRTAKKYSIPIVSHIVDIYPEALVEKLPFFKGLVYKLLLPLDRYSLKNSKKIITISPKMKNHLVQTRGINTKNIDVIYNWQNEEWFLSYKELFGEKTKKENFTFMYLGNLSRTAALDILLYAFDKSNINNSKIIIAGNGSEKETLVSIASDNKNNKIEFWDAPMKKVPDIQDHADVLLISLKKGASLFALPSKLSAYMFSEKPIIACVEEESDTAEAIKRANCGWVVPPENIDNLVETFRYVASLSTSDLQIKGNNGYKYALENYSKNANLEKLVTSIVNNL